LLGVCISILWLKRKIGIWLEYSFSPTHHNTHYNNIE
jgi:hypothetical protein